MPNGERGKAHAPAAELPSAELFVVWGAELRRPYLLGPTSLLGRGADCDIVLDDDGASRHHARVVRVDGRYWLHDLGSTNGTWVNGLRVEKCALGNGDVVQIGKHRLQFWSECRTIYEPHLRAHDDRRLLAALDEEGDAAVSGERAVSLVLFDLDHFKRLNDAFGYVAGDAVLAHVAAVVRGALRTEDTLSRIGGEEFGIVLPGRDLDEARQVAEDVRRAVDANALAHDGKDIHVTISCGVVCWSKRSLRPWQLLREAEARLYDAKVGGRNRVC